MNELRCIVYVSSAVAPFSDDELEALLLDARGFNEQAGISGVLLHAGDSFLQYFEGPPEAVAETYKRIKASRRHRSIRELLSRPISARLFPDWLMGVTRATESTLLRLQNAHWGTELGRLSRKSLEANPGLAMLLAHYQENQGAE